MDLMTNSMESQ